MLWNHRGYIMGVGDIVNLFHGFSAAIIASIIALSMVVAFIVFRYFDKDFLDGGTWND